MHSNTLDKAKSTGNFDIEDIVQRMLVDGIKPAIIYLLTLIFYQIIQYILNKFLEEHKNDFIENTNQHRYVRYGSYKERVIPIFMGIAIPLSLPRILDRCPEMGGGVEIDYPFWQKNSRSCIEVDNFSLQLYLKGVSLGSIRPLIDQIFG